MKASISPSRNGRMNGTVNQPRSVRVAIYTRKSLDDGLDQEFNSLDAQREEVEAYVLSQRSHGWTTLSNHYDDGGFSGSTTDRPAFTRLVADIKAGAIDVVAVYKIDRLSRSLLDFTQLMQTFEQHGVTFVSVTQQFSTSTSVGRMTLNLLATFAQFERETIAERVRDKIHSSRKRGMWTGGQPPLGYVVKNKKLIVHITEADDVRHIFGLYLQLHSLREVATTLNEHGKHTKVHVTKAGKKSGGHHWNKNRVASVLKNSLYIGKVLLHGEQYHGEHEPIVERGLWDRVQAQLQQRKPNRREHRQNWESLLGGLLHCSRCGSKMYRHYTSKSTKRYASYVCAKLSKSGADACPRSRVPASGIEQFVVDQIRQIGRDPSLVRETLRAANAAHEERLPELRDQQTHLDQRRRHLSGEHQNVVDAIAKCNGSGREALLERLEVVDAQLAELDRRAQEIRGEIAAVGTVTVDDHDLRNALVEFDQVWNRLVTAEQARVLELLIERITYDGTEENLSIEFRNNGVKRLAELSSAI